MKDEIIRIPRAEFNKLKLEHPDYIARALCKHEFNGKICNVGDWMGFASILTGNNKNGTELIFEHIHFELC